MQCAQLLEEASARIPLEDSEEAGKVYSSLQEEFAPEMDSSTKPTLHFGSPFTLESQTSQVSRSTTATTSLRPSTTMMAVLTSKVPTSMAGLLATPRLALSRST